MGQQACLVNIINMQIVIVAFVFYFGGVSDVYFLCTTVYAIQSVCITRWWCPIALKIGIKSPELQIAGNTADQHRKQYLLSNCCLIYSLLVVIHWHSLFSQESWVTATPNTAIMWNRPNYSWIWLSTQMLISTSLLSTYHDNVTGICTTHWKRRSDTIRGITTDLILELNSKCLHHYFIPYKWFCCTEYS